MTDQNTQSPPTPPSDKKPKINPEQLTEEGARFYKHIAQAIVSYPVDFRSKIYALPEVIALLVAGYVHDKDQDSLVDTFCIHLKDAMPDAREQIRKSEELLEEMQKMNAAANVEAPATEN